MLVAPSRATSTKFVGSPVTPLALWLYPAQERKVLGIDGAMEAQRGEALPGVPQLAYDIGRQTQVSAPICWYASPSEYG